MSTIKVTKEYLKGLFRKSQWPVLAYCEKLLEDKVNPKSSLEVYGNHDEPDLIVPNIGKYAKVGPKMKNVAKRREEAH